MSDQKTLRVCATCPWLTVNHGKKHPAAWYKQHDIEGWNTKANLRRLWTGLRTGEAPGMVCHSSDSESLSYGGKEGIKPGHKHECTGSLLLMFGNVNAFGEGQPQPFQPPLTKPVIADLIWRKLVGQLPVIEDRLADVSLPWNKKA